MKIVNPVLELLRTRGTNGRAYCVKHGLAYGTFIAAVNGSNPTPKILRWLKDNDKELFSYLPKSSRDVLKMRIKTPPLDKKGGLKSWFQRG